MYLCPALAAPIKAQSTSNHRNLSTLTNSKALSTRDDLISHLHTFAFYIYPQYRSIFLCLASSMSSPASASLLPESSTDPTHRPPTSTRVEDFALSPPTSHPPRLPSLRSTSDSHACSTTTAASTPLAAINAARRPGFTQPALSAGPSGSLPHDMQAKMRAFHLSRQGAPPPQVLTTPANSSLPPTVGPVSSVAVGAAVMSAGGIFPCPSSTISPTPNGRPSAPNFISAPSIPHVGMGLKMNIATKRGHNRPMKLSDASGPPISVGPLAGSGTTSQGTDALNATQAHAKSPGASERSSSSTSLFSQFSEFVDTKTGTLKFKGKATIHGKGIDFSGGTSFSISLDEVDNLGELGKGNYGTVYKVRHSRPQMRRPGHGLNSQKHSLPQYTTSDLSEGLEVVTTTSPTSHSPSISSTTGVVMAMKEIRLELDVAKFAAIIMELDILHRCVSPFIIDFYGAFFQEGAVYICIEFMDGGSVDKLYGDGIPEGVLRKITISTIMGLKVLKDEHNIIHRDVKPTNILVNSKGQVKICDFGVSGNLVASIAKTNIGCQSYMAPERIASGGVAQASTNPGGGTYSVQSDIWSLGLSIIECAMGQYPYPPETYNNIFSQLSASLPLVGYLFIPLIVKGYCRW